MTTCRWIINICCFLLAITALVLLQRRGVDNLDDSPSSASVVQAKPPELSLLPQISPEAVSMVRHQSPVLRIANSFPDGGGFNWDGGTGTPEEIRFKGKRILSKARRGTYCCGFTFAVVMQTADDAGLLKDKTVAQIRQFQQHWYAATPQAREKQQIYALEWLGIGREIPLMEARPGDFLRLWHGRSGHSVIFVRWVVERGKKVGLEYRGTQGSTDGIGNRIEYLPGAPGHEDGDFSPDRTYTGRLTAAK